MGHRATPFSPLYASMPMLYYHHDQLWAETPEHFLEHLDHDFDFRTDDIWLSSYPRSGTAWTYEVLYAVLYGGEMAALQQAKREGNIRRFGPLEVGTAASVSERLSSWMPNPSPRVIPTHLPYRLYPRRVLERQCPRVYVVRHPKDVAVSFYHYHRSHQMLGLYKGTWDEFFECFLSGQIVYGSWFDHTLEWWTQIEASPEHVLVLHYEDMKHDLAAQIRRMGDFLGKSLPQRAVQDIAEYATFERMKANPLTNREGNPRVDFSIAHPMRKGEVGDWRNYFTTAQDERFRAVWDQKMRGTTLM